MTSSKITATEAKPRSLLDRPQPLGILPTYWFWRDPETSKLARWLMAPLAGVTVLVIVLASNFHPLVAGLVAASVMVLANGLLERYVRHQATKRRALAASVAGGLERRALAQSDPTDEGARDAGR